MIEEAAFPVVEEACRGLAVVEEAVPEEGTGPVSKGCAATVSKHFKGHLRIALILRANSTDSTLDSNTCSTRMDP
jgi:hypothetical protein